RPASTVVDRLPVSGFLPYQSRPHFAARAVDSTADHDIDNVRVTYLGLDDSVISFDGVCHSAVETDGARTVEVVREGNTAEPATVRYSTVDGTAAAGSDYVAAAGTLEFAAGETTKSISLTLIDDALDEGDVTFQVRLDDAAGAVIVGPATTGVRIVDDERARRLGSWGEVIPSQVVPINMTLLPTGEILYWDRQDRKRVVWGRCVCSPDLGARPRAAEGRSRSRSGAPAGAAGSWPPRRRRASGSPTPGAPAGSAAGAR